MEDLQTKAAQYAAEKANVLISSAIAQAYIDGYRDGYRDKESETPVNLDDSDIKYVDLGLPSGTLWAADYVRDDNGELLYMTYKEAKAKGYKLPTKEQWDELFEQCKYNHNEGECPFLIEFIGPNGNTLTVESTGYKKGSEVTEEYKVHCFKEQDGNNVINNAYDVFIADYGKKYNASGYYNYGLCSYEGKLFSGYRIPVRLVK